MRNVGKTGPLQILERFPPPYLPRRATTRNEKERLIRRWEQVTSSLPPDLRQALEPVFRRRGYQELYLLTATAQAALSHHLDDLSILARHLGVAVTDLWIPAENSPTDNEVPTNAYSAPFPG
jgi:glutathione S-transferase